MGERGGGPSEKDMGIDKPTPEGIEFAVEALNMKERVQDSADARTMEQFRELLKEIVRIREMHTKLTEVARGIKQFENSELYIKQSKESREDNRSGRDFYWQVRKLKEVLQETMQDSTPQNVQRLNECLDRMIAEFPTEILPGIRKDAERVAERVKARQAA